VDGDTTDVFTDQLDLTGVDPSPDAQAERFEELTDRAEALNGPGGSVECGHQPVAR
jgi:hypothetical protein